MSDLILYTSEDGKSRIQLRAKHQTVWLPRREMAKLFDVSTDNVGLHLKNLFEDGELSREATTEESSVVQMEGGREIRRPVTSYNLLTAQSAKLAALKTHKKGLMQQLFPFQEKNEGWMFQ
jgi:hypothetical protein